MAEQIIIALVLGLVEGLTEFIPVSSTGHLILIGHFLGFKSAGTFEVLIQLGAILAILLVYFNRLVQIAKALPVSVKARHFVLAILFGFLPARSSARSRMISSKACCSRRPLSSVSR